MARCASRRGGRAGRQQPPEQMFPSCHLLCRLIFYNPYSLIHTNTKLPPVFSAPPPLPPSPHRQLACTDAARPRGDSQTDVTTAKAGYFI